MRHDYLTLSDVRGPTLTNVCEPCGRRGRYNGRRLIAKHGADVRLPGLKAILANCPKAQAVSIYDRCHVRYEQYCGRP